MYHDTTECWKARFQIAPYPDREVFAGWIGQSIDLVEVAMIDSVERWCKSCREIRKIHDPARSLPNRARNVYLDTEGVAMEARTLVSSGHRGQPMRGFDVEDLVNFHACERY